MVGTFRALGVEFVEVFRARGRAANQPLPATTLDPPIGTSLPGARVSFAVIGSPASSVAVTASGESFLRRSFCSGVAGASMDVIRCQRGRQLLVMDTGVLTGACLDFRREQAEDEAVFVRAPDRAVTPQEIGAGAFLAAKAAGTVEQARREPLEADRDFPKLAIEAGDDTIDQATANQNFLHHGVCRPLRAVSEQITDGDCEVMVRVQKADGRSDDAMAVGIGIVTEGDVKLVLEADQPGHRPGA